MSPERHGPAARNGLERVRHELLTALHFGKLGPGDRVPSVRRLADVTGMNRKTVHRAYRRLADEGLLDLRPGSGTFIAEQIGGCGGPASIADLLLAANRCRATAESLGLAPDVFATFLKIQLATGLRGVPVTLAECNREQLGLIGRQLQTDLGLDVRPRLLHELPRIPASSRRDLGAVITTDCHAAEVTEIVQPCGLPVYRVALDQDFPRQILDRARRGRVMMVVRDQAFAPVFLRLLQRMPAGDKLVRRIQIHEPREAKARLWDLDADSTLVVSPLVEDSWRPLPSERFLRLTLRWNIEAASLDRLRAALALDTAKRHRQGPALQPAPERGVNVHPS